MSEVRTGRQRWLRAAVAAGRRDANLLPRVDDLPESMPEAGFVRRLGGGARRESFSRISVASFRPPKSG